MSPWVSFGISACLAGLFGSIPFSLLVAKWAGGIDLRKHGSGNVGATNVARTLGPFWGGVALLLDALKGALPVLLLPKLLPAGESLQVHQQVVCGVMAILGHMFTPWLGFRGGKGVATGLGVVSILAPWPSAGALAAFVVTFCLTRIVSLCSIVGAVAFAILVVALSWSQLWTPRSWSLGLFSIAVPLLIIVRHRSNIGRLLRGEESALQLSRKQQTLPTAGASETNDPAS